MLKASMVGNVEVDVVIHVDVVKHCSWHANGVKDTQIDDMGGGTNWLETRHLVVLVGKHRP